MQRHHTVSLIAATLLSCAPALAQPCSGYWVQASGAAGVAPGGVFGGGIGPMLTLPSGELLVSGRFTIAGNVAASGLALYNPGTQTWSSVGCASAAISDMALLPSGDAIIGGSITPFAGAPANCLAIYHSQSHTFSSVSAPDAGVSNMVTAGPLTVLPDGDVIVVGSDPTTETEAMARYSPATDTWTPIVVFDGADVRAIAATQAGDLIVGGWYWLPGESHSRYLAQYSPVTGTWSNMGVSPDDVVTAVRALPDGSIAIGGLFLNLSTSLTAFNHVAIYYPATNTWRRLAPGLDAMFPDHGSGYVYDFLQFPSGIIAGGGFGMAGSTHASNIAWFAPSYNLWYSMSSIGTNGLVYHLAALPDGDIVAAGDFDSADSVNAKYIARWNPLFNTWSPLSSGMVSHIAATAPLPDGQFLVAAKFGGRLANLARYDPITNSFDIIPNALDGDATAMAFLPSGDILIGGAFTHTAFIPAPGLAVYHPTANTWTPLPSGVSGGTNFSLNALAVLPSGDFVAGGSFTTAGGVAVSNIARYSPATSQWTALGPGRPSAVHALDVLPDGDLLAGGSSGGLARYHPASNSWTTFGSGTINTMITLPGGDVIVGGSGASQLFRFAPADNSTTPITGLTSNSVLALAYLEPNQLLVGGNISTAGGTPTTNLARLNLDTGVWSGFGVDTEGTGIDGEVTSLTVLPHNDFLMGGDFTRTGFITTAFAARWIATSADYNHDGDPGTDLDIESFFQCLAGNCCPLCSTDFNGDGDLGTDQDIDAFFRVLGGGPC